MVSQKKSSIPVKSSSKMSQKPKKTTSSAVSSGKTTSTNIIVENSKELIKNAAQLLSTEQKSYDEWIWLAAEADLMVKKGIKPKEEEIRIVAEELSKKGLSFQDLHWMIAEKRFINQVNTSKRK